MYNKPQRRWYQFSLRNMLLATACAASTCAYVAWFISDLNAGHRSFFPAIEIICCGIGTTIGVLLGRWWAVLVATVLVYCTQWLVIDIMFCWTMMNAAARH